MKQNRKKLIFAAILLSLCVLFALLGYVFANNLKSYKTMQEIKTIADEDFVENLETIVSSETSDYKTLYETLVINTNLTILQSYYIDTPKREASYEEIGSAVNVFEHATQIAESLAKGLDCSFEDEEWLLSFIEVIETSLSKPEPFEYICSHYAEEGGWYY